MDSLEVGVAGVAVTHQHSGEFGEDTAGVDGGRGAVTDVHEGEVLSAGYVHIRQGTGGAAGCLVGVQQRGAGQQCLHVAEEGFLQPARRATADPGEEPGGDIDRGQRFQHLAGAANR
jgi:hypothetical protein